MSTTTEKISDSDQETSNHKLTLSDRCDSCGAQAFVIAKFANGELFFCGHHYRRWQEGIARTATSIQDDTALINAKPSPSSEL